MPHLSGKTLLLTGASRGIGRAEIKGAIDTLVKHFGNKREFEELR